MIVSSVHRTDNSGGTFNSVIDRLPYIHTWGATFTVHTVFWANVCRDLITPANNKAHFSYS